jgi:hypothetical protein
MKSVELAFKACDLFFDNNGFVDSLDFSGTYPHGVVNRVHVKIITSGAVSKINFRGLLHKK